MRNPYSTALGRFALVLANAVALSCSSSTGCNDVGCFNGLVVNFVDPLEADEVAVTVQFEDVLIRCDATAEDRMPCRELGVTVKYTTKTSIIGIILHDRFPSEVSLTITSSGTSLVQATVKPNYKIVHPNGPECPSECRTSYVDL